jgi:isoaspartyl peptidase/L-asparaginase-like protein (Ntn-hydrolase superfamily)
MDILVAGYQALQRGAGSLDAVELAVRLLEDDALFNAGRGSVLTACGTVEMDAAIMDGKNRRAGAVAAVTTIKNPIGAARAVMETSPHVLLAGSGAETFAAEQGLEKADPGYFITPRREEQLRKARMPTALPLNPKEDQPGAVGTVGAVARDMKGHLAAATSTGGMTNKLPGRVGDSPLIGSGTWADDETCAVSCTGDGELFIRTVFAHEVHTLLRFTDMDLRQACKTALKQLETLGGSGGCIAVDARGNVVLALNTPGMYRAWIGMDGIPYVRIFADEDSGVV